MLDVQNNQISEIEAGSFNGLSNLKILYLRGNKVTILKAEMFQGLVAVLILSLSYNSINSIADNTFANLTKLENLNLASNHLKELSPGMFSGLNSLKILRLERSHLPMLAADVFNHLPRPIVLGLYDAVLNNTNDNPLQCDDELCWLKHEEQQGTFTWFAFNGPTWSIKALPDVQTEQTGTIGAVMKQVKLSFP